MGKMARNIVLGWMVLLLERSRGSRFRMNPMTAMVFVLTNTSGARHHRHRAAGGIVVSAAPSDGSAGWSQEREERADEAPEEGSSAGLVAASGHELRRDGESGWGPLDRRRDPSPSAYPLPPPQADSRPSFGEGYRNNNDLYIEEGSDSPRLRKQGRRGGGHGRRLDAQLSGAVGARGGAVQWARTAEQAREWGVPLDAMPPEFTAEEMEDLSRERAYLNGLVAESAEATGQQ
ncbi:unnamed protein product, partial [Ectocarpus fasciculatus]